MGGAGAQDISGIQSIFLKEKIKKEGIFKDEHVGMHISGPFSLFYLNIMHSYEWDPVLKSIGVANMIICRMWKGVKS